MGKAKIQDMVTDNLLIVVEYGSISEMWNLSRTCKNLYAGLNCHIFNVFKQRLDKRVNTIIPGVTSKDLILKDAHECAISGSIVLSTLLGVEWKDQDIDIYWNCGVENLPDVDKEDFMFTAQDREVQLLIDKERLHFIKKAIGPLPNVEMYLRAISRYGTGPQHVVGSTGSYSTWRMVLDYTHIKQTVEEFTSRFDLSACQSYFDGKVLKIALPELTLNRISTFQHYPRAERVEERFEKYFNRGILFDITGSPENEWMKKWISQIQGYHTVRGKEFGIEWLIELQRVFLLSLTQRIRHKACLDELLVLHGEKMDRKRKVSRLFESAMEWNDAQMQVSKRVPSFLISRGEKMV